MNYRIYVEKKPGFEVETKSVLADLNLNLNLNLNELRLINVYDIFNCEKELLEKAKYGVLGEIVTDNVYDTLDTSNYITLAIEYLPGQFDQRADAAISCFKLIDPNSKVMIKSAKLYLFNKELTSENLARIKHYLINKVEAREKDLNNLSIDVNEEIEAVKILNGFREIKDYAKAVKDYDLAMSASDLETVVNYFNNEGRDPYETELKILDTYWSDHCRHTTFTTRFSDVSFLNSELKEDLEKSYNKYLKLRKELNRENKPLCLMDLATIGAKVLKAKGYLDDLEESEENNACSIFVDLKNNGKKEKWLIQFKNETHNHPTEIEPFGGASTCLGGAIRDPLAGRAYVYQAMRVTGAGNIYALVKDTMPNKLPQRVISLKAASGYSSYGNQIGLATGHVREIYHPNYVAKRLEVGAVVGAVNANDFVRLSPEAGDYVLLLGGLTGRDGIGGATGSSKEHNEQSLEKCFSEVQKGNAPEERKLEHLFKRPEVTKLIKKCNDFGAGGVSVAIGELASGLDIYLDRVPVKYLGLNPTELAISESQERMAVVIAKKDYEIFRQYAEEENVRITHVANVTDNKRLRMYYHEQLVVDISREFIDSAGAIHETNVIVDGNNKAEYKYEPKDNIKDSMEAILTDPNVTNQKGLIEMFDSTIGRSTVLLPFGGKTQRTETQVSCELIPAGKTDLATVLAYGYNPYISSNNPYLGSMYAVVESLAKLVASGTNYKKVRLSFQEYFKKMSTASDFGLPLMALLGALEMQLAFKLPAIGGKDSMSGSYKDINVPPMLMSIALGTCEAKNIISPEFKDSGNYIYLFKHHPLAKNIVNTKELKKNFTLINKLIKNKTIISAYALSFGGLGEALAKMSFGNNIGAKVKFDLNELGAYDYGSIIVESKEKIKDAILLGKTIKNKLIINDEVFDIDELYEINLKPFKTIYKEKVQSNSPIKSLKYQDIKKKFKNPKSGKVKVYIPVFPGTNCDYDTRDAFIDAGADVKIEVFNNMTPELTLKSINKMAKNIDECDILALCGGFSAGDEPDGSGKFIASILNNNEVKEAILRLLKRKCLILGICNGFQALIKAGLLNTTTPFDLKENNPTLFRNDINRHISLIAKTKVMSNNSPWLYGLKENEVYNIAFSHGEGKFVCDEATFNKLKKNGQIAFVYVDDNNKPTIESPYNPNGSYYAIEGIISPDGLILGKMGHTERYKKGLYKNIYGNKEQSIFKNAINYFKK